MITGVSPPEITFKKETAASLASLKEGQVVKAKVLSMLSRTSAQLLIAGQKITAGTQLPLTPGQEIQLRLVKEKNLLTFRMIQPSSQPKTSAREGIPLGRLASAFFSLAKLGQDPGPVIRPLLETLALKSGDRDDGFLDRLIKDSGMLLEKKIATLVLAGNKPLSDAGMQQIGDQDLKAAVLRLLSREPGQASRVLDPGLAREVASALENFQTLNAQPSENLKFILPFPIFAGHQFSFGQLFLDLGKKEGNQERGEGPIRLAFLLDMTALGQLRADFSILNKTISGRFLVEDRDTCDYIASLMPELDQRLKTIGFQLGLVDCQVAQASQLSVGALIQDMAEDRAVKGLDLVI